MNPRPLQRLTTFMNVRSEEANLFFLMMLYAGSSGVAISYFFAATAAVFLGHFDAETLPYAFLASGFALILSGAILRWLQSRVPASQILVGSLVALVIGVLLLRAGLAAASDGALIFSLFVAFRLLIHVLEVGYWSLAARLFTVEQSRRVYNVIGSGSVLIIALASFLIPLIVEIAGPENLFIGAAVAILACLWIVLTILDRYEPLLAASEKPIYQTKEDLQALARNRYIRLIFLLFTLAWMVNYLIDFTYFDRLQDEFGNDPAKIAGFIGVMFGFIHLTNFLLKYALRIMMRYGLGLALLAVPIVLTLGALVSTSVGLIAGTATLFFWVVMATKFVEEMVRESINEPATRLLYQPFASERRSVLLAIVESAGNPAATMLASVVLIVLTLITNESAPAALALMTVLGVLWIFAARRTYQEYSDALSQALSKRLLSGEGLIDAEPSTIALLRSKLKSKRAGEAIYALQMLESLGDSASQTGLADLLSHPSPEARTEALLRIEKYQPPINAELVLRLIESDPVMTVREAALRAYCALNPGQTPENIVALLTHDEPALRRGALIGLLEHAAGAGTQAAESRLHDFATSPEPSDRAFAADILGDVDNKRFYSYMLNLLNDSAPSVQRAALLSAGRLNNTQLWPTVIKSLETPALATAAVSALFMANKSVYPALEAVFNAPVPDSVLLITIARICGRRREAQAITLLEDQFNFPDKAVHHQILVSLNLCGYQATPKTQEKIMAELEEETVDSGWLLASMLDIGTDEHYSHLYRALRTEFEQCQRRLFLLLSFLFDPNSIQRIRDNLALPSADKRAYAMESLGILLPRPLKVMLVPLLADLPIEERLEQLPHRFTEARMGQAMRLHQIIAAQPGKLNAWIHACALYAIAQSRQQDFYDNIVPALDSIDPLVRETALWALRRLDEDRFYQYIAPSPRATGRMLAIGDRLMLLTIEKVLILKTVGIFSRVPDNILVEVASLLEEVELASGETLFNEGDLGNAMYIITEGRVRVQTEKRIVAERGESEFIGEMSLFDDSARSATVKALADTRLLRLGQDAFNELLANHPDMARAIIHVLAERLRESMQTHGVSPMMAEILERIKFDGKST